MTSSPGFLRLLGIKRDLQVELLLSVDEFLKNTSQYENIGQETLKDIYCVVKSQDILCNKKFQCHEVKSENISKVTEDQVFNSDPKFPPEGQS